MKSVIAMTMLMAIPAGVGAVTADWEDSAEEWSASQTLPASRLTSQTRKATWFGVGALELIVELWGGDAAAVERSVSEDLSGRAKLVLWVRLSEQAPKGIRARLEVDAGKDLLAGEWSPSLPRPGHADEPEGSSWTALTLDAPEEGAHADKIRVVFRAGTGVAYTGSVYLDHLITK